MSSAAEIRELKVHHLGLANPTRLEILARVAGGETAASELARGLKLSQPLLSWHLRIMRRAGLIATRRVGREVLCSLDRENIRRHQERLNQLLGGLPGPEGRDPFTGSLTEKEIANAI
jgi:DNA-binding transcriptional ArsR family regulator